MKTSDTSESFALLDRVRAQVVETGSELPLAMRKALEAWLKDTEAEKEESLDTGPALKQKIDRFIAGILSEGKTRPGSRVMTKLSDAGIDRGSEDAGMLILESLRESLDRHDDLETIALKCTILHDFPGTVGGGGFGGMKIMQEVSKKILMRLRKETGNYTSIAYPGKSAGPTAFDYLYFRVIGLGFFDPSFWNGGAGPMQKVERVIGCELPKDHKERIEVCLDYLIKEQYSCKKTE